MAPLLLLLLLLLLRMRVVVVEEGEEGGRPVMEGGTGHRQLRGVGKGAGRARRTTRVVVVVVQSPLVAP